jgi:hypothetical protein
MTPCVYDPTTLCGNTITSKRDCIGCEVRRDVLWDRRNPVPNKEPNR